MIPVLVLSLPRDDMRHRWIATHLGALGIPYHLTFGVDGQSIPEDEARRHMVTFRRGHGRECTRGELGCALTYLRLFKLIAEGPDPFTCVMEDDVELLPAAVRFLEEATLASLPQFDVLRLYSVEHQQRRSSWAIGSCGGHSIVAPVRSGWGTYAQVYSRDGARKLIDRPITGPIDNVIYYDRPPFGLRILEPTVQEIELSLRMVGPCRMQHGGEMCRKALVGGGYNPHHYPLHPPVGWPTT